MDASAHVRPGGGDSDHGRSLRTGDAMGEDPTDVDADEAAPVVYLVVAIGMLVALVSLLIDLGGAFGLATMLAALALTVPWLVYARLAIVRSGPEAVAGGVLLLAVGGWGSVDSVGEGAGPGAWFRLAGSLLLLVVAVFALGALLRRAAPVRSDEPM